VVYFRLLVDDARPSAETGEGPSGETPRSTARSRDGFLVALMIAAGIARIVSTYPVFNHTFDEPVHIAMGLQWLDTGRYEGLVQTPPLGRVVLALGPWLAGIDYPRIDGEIRDLPVLRNGLSILYDNGPYLRTLTLARVGNLVFFVLASIAVWRLGALFLGRIEGLLATLIFTTDPVILGHSGVATTDVATTAAICLVVLALGTFLQSGSWPAATWLALSIAIAVLVKLTFFLFGVAAIAGTVACFAFAHHRGLTSGARLTTLFLRAAAAIIVVVPLAIWAAYRFAVWPPASVLNAAGTGPALTLASLFERLGLPIPAPQFLLAIDIIPRLNEAALYPSYLLGRVDPSGFVHYYPVILAYRTPLFVTALLLASVVLLRRDLARGSWRRVIPLAIVVAMLAAGTLIRTNAGVRYILPIVPFVCLAAAGSLLGIWEWLRGRARRRAFACVAAACIVAPGLLVHPDYLSYFNVMAGDRPERISVDSDLDWGQDLLRLRDEAESRGIRHLHLLYFGTAVPERHDFTATLERVEPGRRVEGWLAVSKMRRAAIIPGDEPIRWLDEHDPVATIGRSILLYELPAVSPGD
jgi:hypothetical protein